MSRLALCKNAACALLRPSATLAIKIAESRDRPVTVYAGQCGKFGQGLFERQMLKTMQGIVMHEIVNGRLARQHMIQVPYRLDDTVPQRVVSLCSQ